MALMVNLPTLPQRLDKHLRDALRWPRRRIHDAIHNARVVLITPNGAQEHSLRRVNLVFPDDIVLLDGEPLPASPPIIYTMLHKPAGIISAATTPGNRPCLTPWLDALPVGVTHVGRLDRDTTGLLLLCNDGDLIYALTEPSHHVVKTYLITLTHPVSAEDDRLTWLRVGVALRDGMARALDVRLRDPVSSNMFELDLDEGRNRQVRRMCHHANLDLAHLHRTRVGHLTLGDLPLGQMRSLTDEEVNGLWHDVGGRTLVWKRQRQALVQQAHRQRARNSPNARLERWLNHSFQLIEEG